MNLKFSVLAGAVALTMIGVTAAEAASSASVNRQFRSAVSRVLNSVRAEQEFLRSMSSREFSQFVRCAQDVMDQAPQRRKEYVLQARNLSEQRQRFDQVALDNRAALKQQITGRCS